MDTPTRRPYTPMQVVRLSPKAWVELIDEDDEPGLFLDLGDEDVLVRIELPRTAEAWHLASSLAWRILHHEAGVKAKTIGYLAEHNAHTGPGAFRPIPRPLGPLMVQQDPTGG